MSMNIGRVTGVSSENFAPKPLDAAQIQKRIQLFTGDAVELPSSIKVDRDNRIALPEPDTQKMDEVAQVYRNASPEQQEQLAQLGHDFAGAVVASGGNLETSGGAMEAVQSSMETFIGITDEGDANQAVQGMLMMGYGEVQNDVMDFAGKLAGNIEAKKEKRLEITDARNTLSDWPSAEDIASGDVPSPYSIDDQGNCVVEFTSVDSDGNEVSEIMTKEQLESKLGDLETELNNIGDLTQMMQMNLQDAMQKQQQFMQTMSNLIKMMHDTAKSIIGNLRA